MSPDPSWTLIHTSLDSIRHRIAMLDADKSWWKPVIYRESLQRTMVPIVALLFDR